MSNTCGTCGAEIKRLEKAVTCAGGCKEPFHTHCIKINNEEYKIINNMKNVGWFCNPCNTDKSYETKKIVISLKDEILKQAEKVNVQDEKINIQNELLGKLLNHIDEIKTELQNNKYDGSKKMESVIVSQDIIKTCINSNYSSNKTSSNRTFAEVANKPAVIIKPKIDQLSDVTRKEIKENIKPSDISVGVASVKNIKNGAIIVNCHNQEDIQKLENAVTDKLGDKYEVKITTPQNPQIGMSEKFNEKQIIDQIIAQNNWIIKKKENNH